MLTGRPTSYTEELEELALEYIDGGYKEHDQVIPSVVGMSILLNVAESTLYRWAEQERGNFQVTLEMCKAAQHQILLNKGLTGDFNATIAKLALANHGHREATSTEVSGPGGGPIQTGIFEFVPVDENS